MKRCVCGNKLCVCVCFICSINHKSQRCDEHSIFIHVSTAFIAHLGMPVHYLHRVCGAAGLGERFRNECTPHEWPHRKRHNARVLAFAFAIISIAVEIARIPVGYTSIRRTRQRTACTMNATGRACVHSCVRACAHYKSKPSGH